MLTFKNIPVLPPEVIAETFMWPPTARMLIDRLTRLPPTALHRS
nr:hypothetical protein [Cellulomonas sp. KRMCY2]